jgi:hypothetical protein
LTHYDEHTLELYVLKAREVAEKVHDIEVHLLECHGCTSIVEELSSLHTRLAAELHNITDEEISTAETALTIPRTSIAPVFEEWNTLTLEPKTKMQLFREFVYKRPVTVLTCTSMFAASVVFALFTFIWKPIMDNNPSYFHYNRTESMLEVFNKSDQKLWTIPANNLYGDNDNNEGNNSTIIADINGDGMNEVVTCLSLSSEKGEPVPLKVFAFDKRLLWKKEFIKPFNYLERQYYNPYFNASPILVFDADNDKQADIFVNTNNSRSPGIVVRLDREGSIIGEYWHFGACVVFDVFDLDGDGKKELITAGLDDTGDTNHTEFGNIVILDPAKIVGEKKSLNATGFQFPFSDAEIYSLKLPRSDIGLILDARNPIKQLRISEINTLHFMMYLENIGEQRIASPYAFEFIFTFDMRILEVKSTSNIIPFRLKLKEEGKVKGDIDDAYLHNLKNSVEYWDGEKWVRQWTMIHRKNT